MLILQRLVGIHTVRSISEYGKKNKDVTRVYTTNRGAVYACTDFDTTQFSSGIIFTYP